MLSKGSEVPSKSKQPPKPPKPPKKRRAATSSGKAGKSTTKRKGTSKPKASSKRGRASTARKRASTDAKAATRSTGRSRTKKPEPNVLEPPSVSQPLDGGDTETDVPALSPVSAEDIVVSEAQLDVTVAILESGQAAHKRAVQVVQALGYGVAVEKGGNELKARFAGHKPPDILLVALPDNADLVQAARAVEPLPPVVVASLAGPPATARDRFGKVDADLFTVRPHSVESLGPVLHASIVLRQQIDLLHAQRATEVRLRDELRSVGRSGASTGFQHFDFFKQILVIEIKRARRFGYSLAVCLVAQDPWQDKQPSPAGKVRIRRKLAGSISRTIRDIDIPVDYADQRYLLFLPYTDIDGARRVGERVAKSIVRNARITESGREYAASASIGIASLKAGKPVSFARLMRDANAALRAAQLKGGGRVVVRQMTLAVSSATRLAAVLGWPVRHSSSPALHNPAFAAAGIDAVMLALPVRPADLPNVVAGLAACGAVGASVTVPHKQLVAPLCQSLSKDAERIGAVNCLQFEDGKTTGHNTDSGGYIDSLREQLALEVRGLKTVLLGAGGAARAVCDGLSQAGAGSVTVVARSPNKVTWTKASAWTRDVLGETLTGCELLVDCTSIGLSEENEAKVATPIPLDELPASAVVSSLVYHREPALLTAARERGHRVIDGLGMLVHQAARAFEIWTGSSAPVDVMWRALGHPHVPTDR